MRYRRRLTIPQAAVRGAVAGLAGGTAFLAAQALEARGLLARDEHPAAEWDRAVRAQLRRRGAHLSPRGARVASMAVHLGYSAALGALYGVARSRRRLPGAAQDALLSAILFAWRFPATRQRGTRSTALRRKRPRHRARVTLPFSPYALFGTVLTGTFAALARGRPL